MKEVGRLGKEYWIDRVKTLTKKSNEEIDDYKKAELLLRIKLCEKIISFVD